MTNASSSPRKPRFLTVAVNLQPSNNVATLVRMTVIHRISLCSSGYALKIILTCIPTSQNTERSSLRGADLDSYNCATTGGVNDCTVPGNGSELALVRSLMMDRYIIPCYNFGVSARSPALTQGELNKSNISPILPATWCLVGL